LNVPIDPSATPPKLVKMLGVAQLVALPIVYLMIAYFVRIPAKEGGELLMMLYILLIIAAVYPAFVPLIIRFQIANYRKTADSAVTPDNLYTSCGIIAFAIVDAIYTFGLVIYFLSGNINWMYYFYPIGVVWSLVYWPTDAKYRKFLTKVQGNEPIVT